MKNPAATKIFPAARAERGQTMAEYSVMLALIALAIVAALMLLNEAVISMFGRVAGYVGG
jgi:Flp pilus assembly pilin Flp